MRRTASRPRTCQTGSNQTVRPSPHATRDIDLSDAPSSAITVDEYNRQVRDFYIVELVDDGGTITDSLVETVPEVTQFWTFDQQEFLANPLFSREFPRE